jgi:DNA-binding MarR family transcriptional regulator
LAKLLVAPLEAVTDPNLSEPERRVLLVLFSFRDKSTDVVFPGIESIAARAGYTDKTRISKITSSLAKKGWLTKKRRGFTGGNSYKLSVPDSAIEHLAKLDEDAKLAREANLEPEANSKLDSEAKSKLVPEAKYKEQTNEQTNEQELAKPQKVADLYNEMLGDKLAKVRILTDNRAKSVRARIREDSKRESLDWWRNYFLVVSECPFLMGQGPPRPETGRPWQAEFEWLIGQNNMAKVIEGKYDNEQ